jgi:hypothetical protein
MKRSVKKKRRRSSPGMPAVRGPFDVGGIPLGGMIRPPGSTRGGGGRLARALRAAGRKPPALVGKLQPTARALARWENEGGSAAPSATSDREKKIGAPHAPKKWVAKHSPKQAKPKPETSIPKKRR